MARHSGLEDATQVRHPWRATTRTVFQAVIGLAVALPLIVASSGIPSTAAGIGTALAISAAITRIMAAPGIDAMLTRFAPWLAAEPRGGSL